MVIYIILGALVPAGKATSDENLNIFLKQFRLLSPMKYVTETLCMNQCRAINSNIYTNVVMIFV